MTADRIAAIRARLEAATPGPWKAEYDGEDVTGIVGNGSRIVETDAGYYPPRSGDADLIASAPEDLEWLLGQVERLEGHLEEMGLDSFGAQLMLSKERDRLRAENAKLREALEYGLNVMMPEIHAQRTLWPGEVDAFEDRARAALDADKERGA